MGQALFFFFSFGSNFFFSFPFRSTKKSESNLKMWKPESEGKRKESVIKNIGNAKEAIENGNMNNNDRHGRADDQANGGTKKSKMAAFGNDEEKATSASPRNVVSKFLATPRADERPTRISPPISSRGSDVTDRTPETSVQSSLVSSAASRSKLKTMLTSDAAATTHPHGAPYYPFSSSVPMTSLEIPSHPASQLGPKNTEALEKRSRKEGITSDSWDAREELRINGMKEGYSRIRGADEHASERELLRKNRKYRKMYGRSRGRRSSDEREEYHLRQSEEMMSRTRDRLERDRLLSSSEKRRRENEAGRPVSNYHEIKENRKLSGTGDERSSKSPERIPTSVGMSTTADRRVDDKQENGWGSRREGTKEVSHVKETDELKKSEGFDTQNVTSHENGARDVHVDSEKDRYEERRISEMERQRYGHFSDRSRDGPPFFKPSFLNPGGMFERRGFDPRSFNPKMEGRYGMESWNLDPRFRESSKKLEKRKEMISNERADEKQNGIDGKEERKSKLEERKETNGQLMSENVRVLRSLDERPRSAPGNGARGMSPRMNEMEKMQSHGEREIKYSSRGNPERKDKLDGAKVSRNNSRVSSPAQMDTSRRQSPVTQRSKSERPGSDDVNGTKSGGNVIGDDAPRASDVKPIPSNGPPVVATNPPVPVLGHLMTAAAAGYQGLSPLNPEAQPFLHQFLTAQNEGQIPMLLMPPQIPGMMYPSHLADPNAAPLMTRDYLTLWLRTLEMQGTRRVSSCDLWAHCSYSSSYFSFRNMHLHKSQCVNVTLRVH